MFRKVLIRGTIGLAIFALVVALGLPSLLNSLGFHAHYEVPDFDLSGKRALIVTTSHDVLGDTGRPTGVAASEMTEPYYAFLDAGMEVDFASIKGGQIPIDPQTLRWPVVSPPDKRYLADQQAQSKAARSFEIGMVDITSYDIVFLAGGWGAAYDFAQSEELGQKITESYAADAVVGGVCHGPLGLLQAKAPDGSPLVAGRKICAVTDKQIEELGISITPKHPERDLRAAGVEFESKTGFRDIFMTHVVVDGRLVTGQNQNSGAETAHRMMEILAAAAVEEAQQITESSPAADHARSASLSNEFFLGTYEFSGVEAERAAWEAAIGTVSSEVPLPMRGTVKNRLSKVAEVVDWFAFSNSDGVFTYSDSRGATLPGDTDGQIVEVVSPQGDAATIIRTLSRDDEGLLVLTEERSSDGGGRTHRYILSEEGDVVTLQTLLKGARLPRDLEFTLSYTRQQ